MRVPEVSSVRRPVLTSAFVRVLALALALPAYSLISAGSAAVYAAQDADAQDAQDAEGAQAKEGSEDKEGAGDTATERAKQEAGEAGTQQQARRVRRPYLGARPDVAPAGEGTRDNARGAASAKSILPAPYVAPGSLTFTVPTPPASAGSVSDDVAAAQGQTPGEATDAQTTLPALDVPAASTQATSQPQPGQDGTLFGQGSAGNQQATSLAPSETSDLSEGESAPASDPFAGLFGGQIVAGTLKDLDASVQAIAPQPAARGGDAAPFFNGFWRGYTHQRAVDALSKLARADLPPALRSLAARAAASQFDLTAAGSEAEQIALIKARLTVFETLGDIGAYAALLDTLPPGYGVGASTPAEGLDLERINAALLSGDLAGACALSEGVREAQASAYGLRIAVVCAAARGNRQAADFSLSVLEELGAIAPDFYELTDILLVEAEQASRGGVQMRSPLRLTPLTVVMAQVGSAEVTALDFNDATPLGLKAALSLPKMSLSARASLLRTALQMQIVTPQDLLDTMAANRAALAVGAASDEGAPAGYTQLLLRADVPLADFMFDMQLMAALADTNIPGLARAALLQYLVERGVADSRLANMAGALLSMSADIDASAPEYAGTLHALRLRLALLAGRADTVRESVLALRSSGTDDNPQSAAALIASLPLMQMAGGLGAAGGDATFSAPPLTPARFEIWWQALSTGSMQAVALAPAALAGAGVVSEDTSSAGERETSNLLGATSAVEAPVSLSPLAQASLFLSASEGLGMPYFSTKSNAGGNALWLQLDTGADAPQTLPGVAAVSPVLWRTYMQARLSGDRPALLVAVSRLMAGQSPQTAEPAMVGSVMEGLCAAGFCGDAQAMSLGLLVDAGL